MKTKFVRTIAIVVLVCALFFPCGGAFAGSSRPPYPRVNPAAWYEVDPAWPVKPADVVWAAVPGVAVDKEDNVWMFTRETPSVQVYAPDGRYLFGWGSTTGSHYIRFDRDGYVWTADIERHTVQKHERDGKVLLTLGVDGEAGADERHFAEPTDMAFASNGDIFVSDGYGNSRIVRFTKDGKYAGEWGTLGMGDGQISLSHSIVIDSKDRVYLADRNNARVQVFDVNGSFLGSWPHLCVPWGLDITAKDEIWVCGSSPMRWGEDPQYPKNLLGCPPKDQLLMKFDTEGKLLELYTFPKALDGQEKPGELNWFHGFAFDSKGNLYTGDITGRRLQKFVPRQ